MRLQPDFDFGLVRQQPDLQIDLDLFVGSQESQDALLAIGGSPLAGTVGCRSSWPSLEGPRTTWAERHGLAVGRSCTGRRATRIQAAAAFSAEPAASPQAAPSADPLSR